MQPWWDKFPGRLEYELAALTSDSVRVEIDDAAFARGVLELTLHLPDNAWPTSALVAKYPDTFPYTRPEVYAFDELLHHHQNPFGHNLCLLGRSTANWKPSDTLANLLKTQLPLLQQALESDDPAGFEEIQGEPITTFYDHEPGSIVFIDSGWAMPQDIDSGQIRVTRLTQSGPLRAVISEIQAQDGRVLGKGPFARTDLRPQTANWFRVNQPFFSNDPEDYLRSLCNVHPSAGRALKRDGIIGIVFPEETAHRKTSDGWLFIHRTNGAGGKSESPRVVFARAGRIGPKDLTARYPLFEKLQGRTVAVFGLGCLGAPSLLQLARCGVGRLNFLDGDFVEPGTAVRWPFGLQSSGWPKAMVLASFISREYPWVSVTARQHRLGVGGFADGAVVDEFLQDVDLVYDATAEIGLQQFLSDVCLDRGLAYLCVSAVAGGTGGLVAQLRPPATGCWLCLQRAIDDNVIRMPKAAPSSDVQPVGCGQTTYVAADYDIQEVALQGVRTAVSVLTDNPNDIVWDVAVLRLRDDDGRTILPEWQGHRLRAHRDCPKCSRLTAASFQQISSS